MVPQTACQNDLVQQSACEFRPSAPLLSPPVEPPPQQDMMAPVQGNATQAFQSQPWDIGPQNMYGRARPISGARLPPPPARNPDESSAQWKLRRAELLRDWGTRRERRMHRMPRCLMDQMTSGSGLFPIRLLDEGWLLPEEKAMVEEIERLLGSTGRARDLAWDMLTPVVYDVEVKIVLDNSGSMALDMFGGSFDNRRNNWIDDTNMENPQLMANLMASLRGPFRRASQIQQQQASVAPPPFSPFRRRWFFARDALRRWHTVFRILRLDPTLYLLNPISNLGDRVRLSQVEQVFNHKPQGTTPMSSVLARAIGDHQSSQLNNKTLLVLALTDGEADDMPGFNALLDQCQNNVYGDVQVCLLGLSLVQRDVEWFENEECDETRIRTIEAYEVEAMQIRLREVVQQEGGYNFDMHSYRSLVTNYFPADYDYEAHLQNLRHRLYITIHGRDRWWGLNNTLWYYCCSGVCCTCCFLGTCCHCLGWCQGNDCGKCEKPCCIEGCCEDE